MPSPIFSLTALELTHQLQPAYCETWDRAVLALMSDPYERLIVDYLIEKIRANPDEPLRPIRVESSRVGNGMHRAVAALLTNSSVLITTGEIEPEGRELSEEFIKLHFRVFLPSSGLPESPYADGDEFFHPCGILRSFPVEPPIEWLEACGFGSSNAVLEGMWNWPHADAEGLVALVESRLAQFNVRLELVEIEAVSFDDDPEEGDRAATALADASDLAAVEFAQELASAEFETSSAQL